MKQHNYCYPENSRQSHKPENVINNNDNHENVKKSSVHIHGQQQQYYCSSSRRRNVKNNNNYYYLHFNFMSILLLYIILCIVQLNGSQAQSEFPSVQLNNNYNYSITTNIKNNNNNETSANIKNQVINLYSCPNKCHCEYESSWKKFKIQCQDYLQHEKKLREQQQSGDNADDVSIKKPYNDSNSNSKSPSKPSSSSSSVDLSDGVRHLVIRNAVLDSKTILSIFPVLGDNTLINLEIHASSLDPILVFNSELIKLARGSLKKIELLNVQVSDSSSTSSSDSAPSSSSSFAGSIIPQLTSSSSSDKGLLQQFARLKQLDSLILEDCSSKLSSLIIQSLPVVSHISIVNSGLSELLPENFAHLISLESLNLSHNHIPSLPPRLTKNLRKLASFDISNNYIEHLQEEVFIGLFSLRKLNISHNRIQYVDNEVFDPLVDIQVIDMSHNNVIQIFEPYFENNRNLSTLNMKNTWTENTFIDSETSARSRMEMEKLINTLQSVKILDLSDNRMTQIPESLTHIPLYRVELAGNNWQCNCQDRWVLAWRDTTDVYIGNANDSSNLWCYSGSEKFPLRDYLNSLNCSSHIVGSPIKYYSHMGINTVLHCHRQGGTKSKWPTLLWITPDKEKIRYSHHDHHQQLQIQQQQQQLDDARNNNLSLNSSNTLSSSSFNHHQHHNRHHYRVLANGNLDISNVTRSDFGRYVCIAQYENLNITHFIHLGVDTSIFLRVRIVSFLIGWATSFGFLFCVIMYHAIKNLLARCGIQCVSMGPSYQTRKIRAFFDSIEQSKTVQLDWLRDNYNMQAKRIKDNCFSQLERIRESYTLQNKNLSDIREYGTNQLHQIRDQYHDQVRKVSGYSAQQLCKVRENYVFQRNRVCKFSSHQMLRLRETYKWQAQTLNKILENLPRTLNLDTCRLGTCGRTDSIYLEDVSEFQPGDESFPSMVDRLHPFGCPEKMEHVSLLIPPELLLGPRNLMISDSDDITSRPGQSRSSPSVSIIDSRKVDDEVENAEEEDDSVVAVEQPKCSQSDTEYLNSQVKNESQKTMDSNN